MAVSNSNDITLETIEEGITNEYLDILIFNAIKSIRNIKKRPDCLSICDHLSKSLSNSEITEDIISNRLDYLTPNFKLKNKQTNGKDSYFIADKADQNLLDTSLELTPCPINYEIPSVKEISPSVNITLSRADPSINEDTLRDLGRSIPDEKEYPTATNAQNDTENNYYHHQIENLTVELMALQLFVKEQLFILKKHVEEITHIQEPLNRTSTSLQAEIEYLREENLAKTRIIKQLTEAKTATPNNCKTTCNCYSVDHKYKTPPIFLDNVKPNKNLDQIKKQQNKIVTEKIESDKTNEGNQMSDSRLENNIKKEKKKNNEIKIKANDKKEKYNVNDITKEKQETVYNLGDSMVKKLNGYLLTKKVRHKFLVKVRPFTGAKVSCMVDHVKPTLRDDKPDHIILHTGTNDLRSEKTSSNIAKSIVDPAMSLKSSGSSVIVSGIVPRFGNLNNKASEVNNRLALMCKDRKVPFVSHSETINSSKHLNESKLHLNHNVIKVFAETFSVFLKSFN